jgi:CheY-like chemotaxis protein
MRCRSSLTRIFASAYLTLVYPMSYQMRQSMRRYHQLFLSATVNTRIYLAKCVIYNKDFLLHCLQNSCRMFLKRKNAEAHIHYQLPKVLIIDDDQAIIDVLKQFFQLCGYVCITRQSADDIIALVTHVRPSVIILDYLLPEINGGDLCGRIKREGSLRDIPVIICSAYPKVFLSLGTYGSNAFIAKPFNLDEVLRTVNYLLYNHPA